MKQVLALSMRPRRFADLVGQQKLIAAIRSQWAQERLPQAWMFVGETGCGKTTVARILAASYQCRHGTRVGSPCRECYRRRDSFDVVEINASDLTGIDDIRRLLQGSDFTPSPGSQKRIYIMDEAHQLSGPSQNLLLKYFEDCPQSTVFMVCTTQSMRIIKTLRRRCLILSVYSLDMNGVKEMVGKAMDKIGSEMARRPLVEKLWENGITSAGLIVNAVEKYASGLPPEEAALDVGVDFDVYALMRATIKGDWEQAGQMLKDARQEDVAGIRRVGSKYLATILAGEPGITERSTAVADSLSKLVQTSTYEDGLQLSALTGVVYQMALKFSRYKR